jgi:uncharacterized protein (TIGR02300 family)
MSTKAERGTKRTCQNPECGSRFYDLNKDRIVCPICQSAFQPQASPLAFTSQAVTEKAPPRKVAKKPAFEPAEEAKPDELPETEDGLAVIEGDDDDAAGGEDDETFLEAEEEDGSDMSNIIGGPVAEPDEPQ